MGNVLSARSTYRHKVQVNYPVEGGHVVRGWEEEKQDNSGEVWSTKYADVEFDLENDTTYKAFLLTIARAVGKDSLQGYTTEVRYIKCPHREDAKPDVIADYTNLGPLIADESYKFIVDIQRKKSVQRRRNRQSKEIQISDRAVKSEG